MRQARIVSLDVRRKAARIRKAKFVATQKTTRTGAIVTAIVFIGVAFFIAALIIRPRDNLLNKRDRILTRLKIRRGDIVLVGNLRAVFSLFVEGTVNHSTRTSVYGSFLHAHTACGAYIARRESVSAC